MGNILTAICVCLFAVFSASPVRLPSEAARDSRATHELTFDFATKQPIVHIKVNGGPAVPFVVDTGASINVIDPEVIQHVDTSAGRQSRLGGGGQTAVDARFVDGLTLAAGGLEWTQQRAAIASLGYPDKKHYAGLLGAPILMRYTVQFAFESRTMRLLDPSTYKPPAGAVLIPFELQENLPIVRAIVDAGSGPIAARLMVDTGASQFVDLNRPFVDAHRLVEALRDATSSDRPAGLGGPAPFVYATGRTVTLGGLVFERPRIGLSRAQSGSSSRSDRDGIIGNDLLRQFVATFDYSRRTLVLESSRS
jgi:hypothetical protein